MPAKTRPLSAYDAKRDFTRSPEPTGKAKAAAGGSSFCVQKHLASHLHYDFRLEHRGVLLSWAVPKGPSLNPADKRMAVHVEDHPVDYGSFEGVIPAGYGAGVVLLWDRGTWEPEPQTPDVDAALDKGELKFRLDGVKLKGSWVLVRTRRQPAKGGPEQWLLIKHKDHWSGEIDVTQLADSVKSFGGLAAVLATHGTPAEWRTQPPVKGGDTGKLLADVMAEAAKPVVAPVPHPVAPPSKPLAGRHTVKFTNRSKALFPNGFTKGDLIDYYARVAPLLLPHLAGRAVTFNRFPEGTGEKGQGKSFFEKHCNAHRPPWVRTVTVPGEGRHKPIEYCRVDDVAGLQWAANLAAVELHVPLALAAAPDEPRAMILDLDPGPPATLVDCVRVGLRLKALLDELGLVSMPKTSGGKGLHILVPLNTPGVTFAQTKGFARAVALTLQKDDPEGVIASMNKRDRTGRVFLDWGQNDRNKTNAAVFSVRARDVPSVSWPLTWADLADGAAPPVVLASDDWDARAARAAVKPLGKMQRLPSFG